MLKLRRIKEDDRNATFMKEAARMSADILYKLQELQMKT